MLLGDTQRLRRTATRWGVSLGALVYFAVLFDFSPALDRTAVRPRFASNFFDLQADALMHGRLSVPAGSLGIEGFVVHGHTYMYFPPFPALLRIPIMLVTREFDGRLSLVSMGLAWVLFAMMATKLFWLVRTCIRGSQPIERTEAVLAAIALAAITGGTVLVFDASLPWAYHEAYAWATALAIGALYWLVRVGLDPTHEAILWLGGFDLCLIMTRTTGGAALCAVTVAAGIWIATGRPHPTRRRMAWAVLAAGLVPVAASVALNLAKFGHPYLFPLQDQIWTQLSARRRAALAHNGGTITGPQFLLTGVVNYLRPDGIRFTDYFPWVSLPARPARAYGGAFLDQSYRTGSVPAFMPFLTLATLGGLAAAGLRRRTTLAFRALRLPLLGALLIPFGVLDYGYVAHRYTNEFVPLLVLGTVIGCAELARRLPAARRMVRLPVLGLLAALAAFGMLANALTGYTAAQQTWGGGKLVRYVELQRALGGDLPVVRSAGLPASGPTDELRIVGDCDGLYLASGDQYQPWLTVQRRPLRLRIIVESRPHNGLLPLLTLRGVSTRYVDAEFDTRGRMRVLVISSDAIVYGRWQPTLVGGEVDVLLTTRTDVNLLHLSTLPGGHVAWLPYVELDAAGKTRLTSVAESLASEGLQRAVGVRVVRGATPPPSLCADLARTARTAAVG